MFRYGLADAERWAAFSGDYNPIHFDRERAAALGSDELSVHGMRAMLDLKHFISEAVRISGDFDENGYLAFTARLRQPLWCNRDYGLSQSPSKRAQRLSVTMADQAGEVCLDTRITGMGTLTLEDTEQPHELSSARWSELDALFPHPADPFAEWIFLDALLFQLLVREPEAFQRVKACIPGGRGDSLQDIFAQLAVIQTHHETCFHGTLLQGHTKAPPRSTVHYAVLPPLITGDMENGAILRIGMQAWNDAHPLMTTAMTLKAWVPEG